MSSLLDRVEPFITLATTSDQELANRICGAIEDSGIPVLLEHIHIKEMDTMVCGYRLMAPSQFKESACRIAEMLLSNHHTKLLVTLRSQTI